MPSSSTCYCDDMCNPATASKLFLCFPRPGEAFGCEQPHHTTALCWTHCRGWSVNGPGGSTVGCLEFKGDGPEQDRIPGQRHLSHRPACPTNPDRLVTMAAHSGFTYWRALNTSGSRIRVICATENVNTRSVWADAVRLIRGLQHRASR